MGRLGVGLARLVRAVRAAGELRDRASRMLLLGAAANANARV